MERGLQKVNHHSRLVEWGRRVEVCRNSGQHVSEWCVEQGMPVSTYRWQRKVFRAVSSENEVCLAEVPARPENTAIAASIQCGELLVDIHAGADAETPSAEIMLSNFKCSCPVYLVCGYTDLRRGIDGLAGIVQTQFHLDPFQSALFLFCGRRKDRIKGLYWEGDGFVLVYKRLESGAPPA